MFVTELFPTWRNSSISTPLTWPDSSPGAIECLVRVRVAADGVRTGGPFG